MQSIIALTFLKRECHIDPKEEFRSKPGRIIHRTFLECILPSLQPVDSIVKCRYESRPLSSWLGELRSYPRSPRHSLPRFDPTSEEIYADLWSREQGVLVRWEHLAMLLLLQSRGQRGLLSTGGSIATLCFMKGEADEVFLVRVFWDSGKETWYIRAWSFEERVDRGWSRRNLLLLPWTPRPL